MYNISQLNEMLVPELKDIADQLNIPNKNISDKQALIFKILDVQGLSETANDSSKPSATEKPRRKRIIKGSAPLAPEEAAAPKTEAPIVEVPMEQPIAVEENVAEQQCR